MLNFKRKTTNGKRRISSQTKQGDKAYSPFRRHKPDYSILLVSVGLMIIGLIVVYSISPALAAGQEVGGAYYVVKQIIAIFLGLAAFWIFSLLPIDFIKNSSRLLIWFSVIMVLVVQVFGDKVNGAARWIQIGGISFQVAELIKFTVIVWLAGFLLSRLAEGSIRSWNDTLKPIFILLAVTSFVVVGLQSDLGSAGVIVAIIALMAYAAGMPLKKMGVVAAIIVIGLIISVAASPYRRERIATYLNPSADCQSAGYQSCQALIAVGSGGLFGQGVGNGVQAYGYLPEAENDSIFAIIGEKFGFIGSSAVIGLYIVLFYRLRRIISRTEDSFARLYVIGVLGWISVQMIINVGAMIGILPLKGITLPLVSYGGTSLVFILAALGVVFHISRYTSYAPLRSASVNERGGTSNENTFGRRRQRRPYYASNRSS